MFNFFKLLKKSEIDNPPYDYNLLINLEEKEYPKYLKKIYKQEMGEELNLFHPKKFNEKIQWLKLYDSTPLKTQLTDKILVRDWVKEKIGEEYLKPVLWKGKNFDDIPFENLPDNFIIKANNGCKWQYVIKDKKNFLEIKPLYNIVKKHFDAWMQQTFFPFAGFEMQYKDISPQILIEPMLIEENNKSPLEFEIFCFNGKPKLYQRISDNYNRTNTVYNEDFKISDISFSYNSHEDIAAEVLLFKAVDLSKILCKEFKLVRVDWMVYKNKIYFNEMTFTPFSGFYKFPNQKYNKILGKMLKI